MQFNTSLEQAQLAASNISLLLLDVDGVLTDGQLYFLESGDEFKAFHTLDGHGIKQAAAAGLETGIITGRNTQIVARRCEELGIELVYQGREDKLVVLEEILAARSLKLEQIAYAGDDLPDLPVLEKVGLSFSVPNAHPRILEIVDAITSREGGKGAVREITDFLLDYR